MRIVALLFLILGVVLAGSSIYLGQQYLAQQQAMAARPEPGPQTVTVMAAKRQLNYGHRIAPDTLSDTLQWVEWPAHAVPDGAFTTVEELIGEGEEPRVVLRTIEPGELVLRSKVSDFGGSTRVATRVSEGMRAFSIPINAVSGVAGLVTPGDRVDILLTRTISRQLTTSVILQNVLVIAVDQVSNTENDRARVASTATVEVSPTDASKLALAQQVGRLSLTLRGMDTPETPGTEGDDMGPVQVRDLPDQPDAPVQQETQGPTQVKVRKGGQVETITVD